jgi:hypothetical protein
MGAFGYSVAELERETKVSHWTWRRLIKDGDVRCIRIASRLLVPAEEVERIKREGVPRKRKASR